MQECTCRKGVFFRTAVWSLIFFVMVLRRHAAVAVLLAGLATVCANRNTVMSNLDFVPVHKRRLQDLDGEAKPESINAKWQCPAVAKEHQDTHNLYHLRGVNLGR
jgi:hypothetical protein